MRVLWVSPQFPSATGTGGSVHEFELLRQVAARHEIVLLTPDWNIRPEDIRTLNGLGVRAGVILWPHETAEIGRGKFMKLIRLVLGVAPNIMVSNREKRIPPLAAAVSVEQSARPFDLVAIFLGDMAPIVAVARAPSALLLFDVYSRQTALVSAGLSPRAIRYRLERRNATDWESSLYRRADGVASVSPIDAELLSRMLGHEIGVVPNPIPDDFFTSPRTQRSPSTVTFVGSFGWEPNVDSLEWLCAEIWPSIKSRRPDARLVIVGRYGNGYLQEIVEQAGGEFFGDVDDIRPFYWESAVVVAPVRMGSGTRNKVLHALACGAPVVSTTSALEGIPAVAGEHLLVADDASGIADAVVETLNDPSAARARAELALGIAEGYSAAAAGRALETFWENTIEAAGSRQPAVPATATLPRATIVVCTKERPDVLRKALQSVGEAAAAVPGTQVLVVEQGEPYASAVCSELGLREATVVQDSGVGASRARNIGFGHARGDVVLFTDDDCEVPIDWVRAHVEALADTSVAASFGPVTGLRHYEEHDPVTLPLRHHRGSPPWLIGHASNIAVRRSAIMAVGGFDERLGPGIPKAPTGEDADLIVRLLRNGSILVSGVGDPVRHIEWRSTIDHQANLKAYEYGAGIWIGKAFREEPRAARGFLRARLKLLELNDAYAKKVGKPAVPIAEFREALKSGVRVGFRMRAWRRLVKRRRLQALPAEMIGIDQP